VPDIQTAAVKTNQLLFNVIQNLPITSPSPTNTAPPVPLKVPEGAETVAALSSNRSSLTKDSDAIDAIKSKGVTAIANRLSGTGSSSSSMLEKDSTPFPTAPSFSSRTESPLPDTSGPRGSSGEKSNALLLAKDEWSTSEPFDYQAMVSALTVQFLSEHEDTRVAALKWLIMLHQKVPQKVCFVYFPPLSQDRSLLVVVQILAMDDGTFPALLKTLSDTSEEVIKHDLQLLAQISSSSEESYFKAFMVNLLDLFSTDKRLLETRGSLIIRQLCLSLNTERIYRTLAEILEKEEDLEFASDMVQKLNLILITCPELAESRKRLKTLETRVRTSPHPRWRGWLN
jgi:vacuole morphology and inheritance protein 14